MENTKNIKILTVNFENEIKNIEIPFFRGAVLAHLGSDGSVLYHNHTGDTTFRYSYPLIQYKQINGKAAIVCIEEGADIIGKFMTECEDNIFMLGNRKVAMEVASINPSLTLVQVCDEVFEYSIKRWLPLNSDNYKKFTVAESLTERIVLLEQILRGNLLSMCKGLGIMITEEIKVFLLDISAPHLVKNKNTKLMAFDVTFKTNLSIPEYIGIGKNASIGYGIIKMTKNNH